MQAVTEATQEIARAFVPHGAVLGIHPHGRGLINDTYLVSTDNPGQPRLILQRINRRAFPEPELIIANLRTLLEHIHARQRHDPRERDLRFPDLCPAHDGRDFILDAEGALWRALSYLENTCTFDKPDGLPRAAETGFALARFHTLVSDLDTRSLHDTRPDFHNTPRHLERFDRARAAAGPLPESEDLGFCLSFIGARRRLAGQLEAARLKGELPVRVIHGDPKLNNFLFDETDGHAVSLIDLDTVKPGLLQHDVADCLRSCCNRVGESPGLGEAVRFDLEICRMLLQHYFAALGDRTPFSDTDLLYAAIRLIPFELGVRFLTDYLEGNHYFRIEYPEQNLVRATTQLRLSAEIELSEKDIKEMIGELVMDKKQD
ncbi:MAG: aminoglycoside phosphotransferase family protein [Gammaproteobacteria bacterium]|nr:aminoglycoside phosphotransferase family protein [Gammaproteobacteria bacterium]